MRTDTRDSYLESIHKAIAYIEANLTNDILLKDIALEASLSQYHFHRIFKAITGNTAKDFITRIRLEKAAFKLKHSENEIGQIALESGYQNHETFTRAFKVYFGMPPNEYRNWVKTQTNERQKAYEKANMEFEHPEVQGPVIKHLLDLHLAYIRHTGSYSKVGQSFQQLMLWAARHWVLKLKPVTIGIVHDDPDLTAEPNIRFDACVLISKPIKPDKNIGYKCIKGGKYAVFTYKGDYDGFYKVYDYIYNICLFNSQFELADKPALEWYVKSPPFYKPKDFVTEFYVPLE